MRKLFLFSLALVCCSFLNCHSQVPKEVQEAFEEKYPDEENPKWNVDRNNNFEAHFKEKGEVYRADFTPKGEWIETERSIKKKDLPELVRRKLKSDYHDFEIIELEETRHHEKGLFYDVELKKDGKKRDVEFRVNGQIIN
ncbi:MAG: PepSY-like domain-containing protein [Aurantibacter sp.]